MHKLHRRLGDIVSFGTSIVTKLRKESHASFVEDADLHDLIYFRLLCVSEAARNALLLDPEIAQRNPGIPWREIRGLGNVLRHEYGEIEPTIIWETFTRGGIDALVAAAQKELARLDP